MRLPAGIYPRARLQKLEGKLNWKPMQRTSPQPALLHCCTECLVCGALFQPRAIHWPARPVRRVLPSHFVSWILQPSPGRTRHRPPLIGFLPACPLSLASLGMAGSERPVRALRRGNNRPLHQEKNKPPSCHPGARCQMPEQASLPACLASPCIRVSSGTVRYCRYMQSVGTWLDIGWGRRCSCCCVRQHCCQSTCQQLSSFSPRRSSFPSDMDRRPSYARPPCATLPVTPQTFTPCLQDGTRISLAVARRTSMSCPERQRRDSRRGGGASAWKLHRSTSARPVGSGPSQALTSERASPSLARHWLGEEEV